MTAIAAGRASAVVPVHIPELDIVIPVYNEEIELEESVSRLVAYVERLPFTAQVTIADNASTDGTSAVADRLAQRYASVESVRLPRKGRGGALKAVWSASRSPVVAYMDVDLSTDLNALLPLVAPLMSGHSDLAIGTRLTRSSRVQRGMKREAISRCYNVLLRGALRTRFSDAQCGFKAMRREVADRLLPLVRDDSWFFDTELLVLAEHAGLRIHEVPVDWIDDPDSRVDIVRTALDDLRGIARLSWSLLRGEVPISELSTDLGRARLAGRSGSLRAQMVLFVLVGIASTAAYAGLYLGLRHVVGAQLANALALMATAVANTSANRRLTFGVRGAQNRLTHQAKGLLVFAAGLAATSLSLWVVDKTGGDGHPTLEIVVLTATNLAVTVLRFVAMRTWIFRHSSDGVGQTIGQNTPDVLAHPM
jgi:putative flippase GtrA